LDILVCAIDVCNVGIDVMQVILLTVIY